MNWHEVYQKRLQVSLKEVSYIWTLITSPICSVNQMWHQVASFLPSNQCKITETLFSLWAPRGYLIHPTAHWSITQYHLILRWAPPLLLAQGTRPQSRSQRPLILNTIYLDGCFLKPKTHHRHKFGVLARKLRCTWKTWNIYKNTHYL